MPSKENRVIAVAVLATLVAVALLLAVEASVGTFSGWWELLSFVLAGVVAVALPQLYLARTDSSVSPSTRIRATVVILFVLAMSFSPDAGTDERIGIWAITGVAFLLATAREVRAGYRSAVESG